MRRRLPENIRNASPRVLVTGSRGKSTIVRMIHAAFVATGLDSRARITGVVPRQLTATGSQEIKRSSGAHVEEMRWWLSQLPESTDAIVMENSAITPEFQPLAGNWLEAEITVLSNTLPDHQEVWGPDQSSAARVLIQGIPKGGRLVIPESCRLDHGLIALIKQRGCRVIFAEPAESIDEVHKAINAGLAMATIRELGLSETMAHKAISALPNDIYDFDVIRCRGAELAMAFSANDIYSTGNLFESLQWPRAATRLVYNHRKDRPERLKSFRHWLNRPDWQDVMIIGDRPMGRAYSARYKKIRKQEDFLKTINHGDRIFGCGNVSGIPVSLMQNSHQSRITTDNH